MKNSLLVLLGLAFCHLLSAQSNNPWIFKSESQFSTKQHFQRQIIPDKYKTAQLDLGSLKSLLQQAPLWQTDGAEKKAVSLSLPMPDGSFQEFSILEAPIMHPDLQKKYPLIRSYAGTGVDDPTAYLRFDLTPAGFHAMILTGMSSDIFIDPYSQGDLDNYVIYYKKDYVKKGDWQCLVEENSKEPIDFGNSKAGDCKLRTYSLALACTGEYAAYHGGTSTSALAAMNTTMTRVNGIFEKDLSVTLQLVANNNLLVYTSTSDPYTNNNGSTMLTENINNCNAVIGSANYDIGHVFSTGGGGIAYVKAVCSSSVKAGGVTGSSAPIGDAYDVDYVAHEMGHQLGANHVQNNACNRNDATAVEPGSGSTIMGYAGVCTPNIQSHSDAYFNAISLAEIAAHVTSIAGNGCATSSTINNAPTANAGADFVIPKSTNFVLTGTGTDPDAGQTLTYCWEQMDNAAATMPPVATNSGGPIFRSFSPGSSASRYFPNLTAIVNNTAQTWEVLPSVGRSLNFRFTVRDNKVGGGCTKEDNMLVTVDGNSGPFVLSAPNTAVSWAGGSSQTVTWSVANTTAAPVSCANVDILLSTDGGFTYPITILSGTPNDGSQSVTIPNNPSSTARIMVRGSGNIFFDISNVNFTITSGANPPLAVSVSATNVNCNGSATGSATANPTGGSGTFTYAWSNGATTQTINNLAAGTYTVTVTSSGATSTASTTITQPAALAVAMSSVNPTSGSNGSATATPSGGTSPFTYAWSSGGTTQTIGSLAAGTYTVTVTDSKGCTKTGSVTLTASVPSGSLKFEYGLLTNVTNAWQTVTLQNTYTSMVVVANVVMASSTAATATTRIQNATGNSFQIKLQVAGNATGTAGPASVYFIVAEEGTYTTAANGVKFEAKKFSSTKTSRSTTWVYETKTYSQTYTTPVVIGQVMTYNDPNWSVAWVSSATNKANPPTASSLSISKHIGEDKVNTTRANETIGYFVFETGTGFINGKKYRAANGSDIVKGPENATAGYSYSLTGMTTVEAGVLGACAMDGSEGYVPAFATATPLTATTLKTWAVEDQITDTERSHTTDQIAWFVIGTGSPFVPGEEPQQRQAVENEPPASDFAIAYPNPARNEVTIEFQQNQFVGPELLLLDGYGKLRQRQVLIPAEAGMRQAKLDLSEVEPGIYYLHIFEGNHRRTVKVVRMVE